MAHAPDLPAREPDRDTADPGDVPGADRPALVTDRPAGAWGLLLLLPLLCLVTPLFNTDEPRFLGLPAFYWAQFLAVPLGVVCTLVVLRRTRARR